MPQNGCKLECRVTCRLRWCQAPMTCKATIAISLHVCWITIRSCHVSFVLLACLLSCMPPVPSCLFCTQLRRKGDTNVSADDGPEEGLREGVFQLRSRWYRSTISKGGQVCCVHPEAEATAQCLLCLRLKLPHHLSFHCSTDCMKKHWQMHREYHANAVENKRAEHAGRESHRLTIPSTLFHLAGWPSIQFERPA